MRDILPLSFNINDYIARIKRKYPRLDGIIELANLGERRWEMRPSKALRTQNWWARVSLISLKLRMWNRKATKNYRKLGNHISGSMSEILLMKSTFFKECRVYLIFLGINLLSISRNLFWCQSKPWSLLNSVLEFHPFRKCSSWQIFLCCSEGNFKDRLDSPKQTGPQLPQSIS